MSGSFIGKTAPVRLRRQARDVVSAEGALRFVYSFEMLPFAFKLGETAPFSIRPVQIIDEALGLMDTLLGNAPRFLMELGTARGGTLFLLTRVASSDALILSVDLPNGPYGGGYPEWKADLFRAFAKDRQCIHLIRGNSHKSSTFEKVRELLGRRQLDFIFVDADHSYEGVRRDYEMYSPLVRKGGMIAFHDIVPGLPESLNGVPRFWNEIKQGHKYVEIVKDWGQSGYGIGIIYV